LHDDRESRTLAKMQEPIRLRKTDRVVVLTGAGISAESGIPTFRDANGLWENHAVEAVASPEGFASDPALVWRFYSERRAGVLSCKPNAAHSALAYLESQLESFLLVTQNVDPLHELAGSKNIIHMHGELFKTRCERESCTRPPFEDQRTYLEALPACTCGGMLRPHIVWFGEMPFEMHTIKRAVQACDVFITVGSSGAVYPAAGLASEITYRRSSGESARAIYVGLEEPQNAASFQELRLGKATEALTFTVL
jgi:NAD-dependent deacetylase